VPASLRDTIHDGEGGSVLLAALIVTLMATVLLVGAAHEVGVRLEGGQRLRRGRLALAGAQAGLEAAARLASAAGFLRGAGTNPLWIEDRQIGAATVAVNASDPGDGRLETSGALGSSDADTVRLTATARVAGIERTLASDWLPLPHLALRNAICARGSVTLGSVLIEGRVRANGGVTTTGSTDLFGDVTTLAGGSVSSILDDGDTDIFFVADSLPFPAVDLSWFVAAGERISLPAFPAITSTWITPDHNPYGSPSPEGIYWIDAAGANIALSDLAVVACLVVRNARTVYVSDIWGDTTDYYHASPDPGRLPALIVEGDLVLRIEGGKVWNLTVDGTPLVVTSGLEGVFYCTGSFVGPQDGASTAIRVHGAILADEITLTGPSSWIRHDADLNTLPLAQLTRPGLRVLAGSVREP